MQLGEKNLGSGSSDVYIIAEIGGNHNGCIKSALELVSKAAEAGADAVKFQSYTADTLVHRDMEAVPLARRHFTTQFERFESLQLSDISYEQIIHLCDDLGIDFLTTPYNLQILQKFASFMPAIKIASGDATYPQLISAAVETGKPVITSTGFCNYTEIDKVAELVPPAQCALLHCVSIYPLPDNQANLQAIPVMQQRFSDRIIGYSDHTVGDQACIAAVGLGARIVEKHFTLDAEQSMGDHVLSLEPNEFGRMVQSINRVAQMRGDGTKPSPGEDQLRKQFRRGVYASRAMLPGDVICSSDLLFIRPCCDVCADEAQNLVGRKVSRDVAKGESFKRSHLE
jgi:sialic acid synthase SpsE